MSPDRNLVNDQYPSYSIIVIAHNEAQTISTCLSAVMQLDYPNYEVIVVDDCSTDATAARVQPYNVTLLRTELASGPAAARNRGAEVAQGEYLLFLDGDVEVRPDLLRCMTAAFAAEPKGTVVQATYRPFSASTNFSSRYMDYLIAYKTRGIHNGLVTIIKSFCFALPKSMFVAVGGFDAKITRATVEDNDLGLKLVLQGYAIMLRTDIQVTHLKQFSLKKLLRRSFYTNSDRMKFIFRHREPKPTNTKSAMRNVLLADPQTIQVFKGSLAVAGLTTLLIAAALVMPFLRLLPVCGFALFTALNSGYLLRLGRTTGTLFTGLWLVMFFLDLAVSAVGAAHGVVVYFLLRRRY